ncbi:FAD-dependent monooxygenase [Rhodohalobacter sp. SW132]|uniref:FAD-dependent monooxygenase n=1 Tax=Rhodohalobacter sp. SW132 TaxID=2293433 RepID=UPI000E224046|nr:FAD-dependent monooxygenase [Rhodohalobacter sp. SW132]REL29069.1 FAD-dependent monooxygenase [Rhodohalobacter sp. SW132]
MKNRAKTDVLIVGGGPVGLYLAGTLGSAGHSVTILEARNQIDQHSKSLGIHPVSLELFEKLGISSRFTEKGIKIQKGRAYVDRNWIGTVDFSRCKKPFNYILALPQNRTEEILEHWVTHLDSVSLIRGAVVNGISQSEDFVEVTYQKEDLQHTIRSLYTVGCDGKNSAVREITGIRFTGKPYPDTYVMGDYPDTTNFGTEAAVYLHKNGLIESFPLPNKMRRWVVKTPSYIKQNQKQMLEEFIRERIGEDLAGETGRMISSFGVQHFLAERFYSGRILLAGDSAHVVSPIGGQGMNLGWITAERASKAIQTCLDKPGRKEVHLKRFSENAIKTAKNVAFRAEINMWLGRKRTFPFGRNLIARLIVNTPLQKFMAGMFTMRRL